MFHTIKIFVEFSKKNLYIQVKMFTAAKLSFQRLPMSL